MSVGLGANGQSKRVVLEITGEQHMEILPLLMNMEHGGSIIAQVYGDGIRCKLLTAKETDDVGAALGVPREAVGFGHSSAFCAEIDSLSRERNIAPNAELPRLSGSANG